MSAYRELPGLCDASRKVLAFPPRAVDDSPRPRWLPTARRLLRTRLALLLVVAMVAGGIGFAAAALHFAAPECRINASETRT